jgi:hypothetical protein
MSGNSSGMTSAALNQLMQVSHLVSMVPTESDLRKVAVERLWSGGRGVVAVTPFYSH